MYPKLPTIDAKRPTENAIDFGARVLRFLLVDCVTATLTDDDLEAADHAAVYVVASHDISPAAAEQISRVRTTIASTLRGRKRDRAADEQRAVASTPPSPAPGGGQRTKLIPPVPRQPSPAGAVNPF